MTLIREPTFSKQILEINIDFFEKYIHSSLQGGPFWGPDFPHVSLIEEKPNNAAVKCEPEIIYAHRISYVLFLECMNVYIDSIL